VSLIWQWLCENWWLSTGAPKPLGPGPLSVVRVYLWLWLWFQWFVLVLHLNSISHAICYLLFVLASPGGALRPGLAPAG
jgi:hypothetical protein